MKYPFEAITKYGKYSDCVDTDDDPFPLIVKRIEGWVAYMDMVTAPGYVAPTIDWDDNG